MFPLPARFAGVILAFAPLFVCPSWRHAQVLLIGAILTPGHRTVMSVLRILGRAQERRFLNTHRILNRPAWCPRPGGRILIGMLISTFALRGLVILALDETIERRRGKRIPAKGIYRDPVRSSDSHFVKASGLRLLSLMLLAPVPRPVGPGLCRSSPFSSPSSAPAASRRDATSPCSTSEANSPFRPLAGC